MSARYDFPIEQGTTHQLGPLVVTQGGSAVHFGTGATATLVMRSGPNGNTLATLTSAGGDISITPATGTLTATFSAATTAALNAGGNYLLTVTFGTGGTYASGFVLGLLSGTIDLVR